MMMIVTFLLRTLKMRKITVMMRGMTMVIMKLINMIRLMKMMNRPIVC